MITLECRRDGSATKMRMQNQGKLCAGVPLAQIAGSLGAGCSRLTGKAGDGPGFLQRRDVTAQFPGDSHYLVD